MRSEIPAPDVASFIPLSTPHIAGREWEFVKNCLDTGWVSSVGSYVDEFEKRMAAQVGTRYAVATTCGTAALHVALLLAGVRDEDEVLMPSLTFIAPANAVRYIRARPIFFDSDLDYWQWDVAKVDYFLSTQCERRGDDVINLSSGRRVAALLPVHILGHPNDLDALRRLGLQYNLPIVEDATESLGSTYKNKPTGSFGRLGCFSFNGNKIITTGGGGMITTDDAKLAERARYLTTQAKDNPVEFIHGEVGFNYRLTNVQAAIGCAQLEQLSGFVEKKRQIAARYNEAFRNCPGIQTPREAPWARSNCWLYTVGIDQRKYGRDSRGLLRLLGQMNVQVRPFWQPLHLSPAHVGAQNMGCKNAEQLWTSCLSLPCSSHLSSADQERVISAILSAANS